MATWNSWGFQEAASPAMEQLSFFHDYSMVTVILILTLVLFGTMSLMVNSHTCRTQLDSNELEIAWTLLPAIVLVTLALPSLRLVYLMEETSDPIMTVKATGHQWYWSYSYVDIPSLKDLSFDSYMTPTKDLYSGQFRLLEVDRRLVLPASTHIRIMVTGADVIHSWTIPALGIKADAIPGRQNSLSLFSHFPGVMYGQCSEICGANHSFMPIVAEFLDPLTFISWIK
uniref:Cytochrome c oxidase subunit 2 n=1 Tax=Brachiopoda sp. TaxID=3230945 RepID=A0AAU8HPG0_9BILA